LSPIRRRIAERLVQAQQTAAILTTFNELDMSAVIALRAEHKERFQKQHGIGLGFMSFFARACIAALRDIPVVNAEIRGDDIIYKKFVHLGVAVGTERGLVVPVLHHAERMSFADIEREIARLAGLARDGKLKLGYVAALRAAQLGMRVACVEKDEALGGTCLNVGCIPSKALLDSSELYRQAQVGLAAHGIKTSGVALDLPAMMARKDKVVRGLTQGVAGLFKKNKVEWVAGTARLEQGRRVIVGERTLEAERVLIATGSEPTPLGGLPFDGERIVSSTEALALARVPERLLVIGAGAVGLELGSVWSRLGAKVTV